MLTVLVSIAIVLPSCRQNINIEQVNHEQLKVQDISVDIYTPFQVTVVLDKSNSESEVSSSRTVSELMTAIIKSKNISKITIVNVAIEGKQAFDSPLKSVDFPIPPDSNFDNSPEKAEADQKFQKFCKGLRTCKDNYENNAKEIFDTKLQKARDEYTRDRKEALDEIEKFLRLKSEIAPNCTDVMQMLQLIKEDRSNNVIFFSDGDHSCQNKFETIDVGKNVLMGLIPLKDESSFSERLEEYRTVFSNSEIEIKPVNQITSEVITEFWDSKDKNSVAD